MVETTRDNNVTDRESGIQEFFYPFIKENREHKIVKYGYPYSNENCCKEAIFYGYEL